jgi:hypothetical protein
MVFGSTTTEVVNVSASTVHLHFTTALNAKSRYFKWVPHFANGNLRAKRLESVEELLDVLRSQENCHFRDLTIGDETWVDLDMKPGTVWPSADTKLPGSVKRTTASDKRILTVFLAIQGIRHYC